MPTQNPRRIELDNLSHALLRLHKALLDAERVSYERIHGRIESNGAFLQLVLGDPWFAWLRPLTGFVAKLHELAEDDRIESGEEITALLASVRGLLTPSAEGDGFGRHYYEALQRVPEVGLAHAAVRGLLRSQDTRKEEPS